MCGVWPEAKVCGVWPEAKLCGVWPEAKLCGVWLKLCGVWLEAVGFGRRQTEWCLAGGLGVEFGRSYTGQ